MNAPEAMSRPCPRCGRRLTPRGGLPPRYCATCGVELDEPAANPSNGRGQPASASWQPRAPLPPLTSLRKPVASVVSGLAVLSFVTGVMALLPGCGAPFALIAIIAGLTAQRRVNASAGTLTGHGLATVGVVLGGIGVLISLTVCGGRALPL